MHQMKTIQKIVIQPGRQQLMIPGDTILSAGVCQGNVVLYALVDTEEQFDKPYETAVYETNADTGDLNGFSFAGTIKTEDNRVLHVFYKSLTSMDL